MALPAIIAIGLKAAQYAATLSTVLPDVIAGVEGAIDVWRAGNAVIDKLVNEKREPTDEEWAELNGRIAALRTDLHTDDPDEIA